MKCPTCYNEMQLRNGKFGEFFFCKNQAVCKQKTISKNSTVVNSNELYSLCKSAEVDKFTASVLEIHYQAARDHIEWLYLD